MKYLLSEGDQRLNKPDVQRRKQTLAHHLHDFHRSCRSQIRFCHREREEGSIAVLGVKRNKTRGKQILNFMFNLTRLVKQNDDPLLCLVRLENVIISHSREELTLSLDNYFSNKLFLATCFPIKTAQCFCLVEVVRLFPFIFNFLTLCGLDLIYYRAETWQRSRHNNMKNVHAKIQRWDSLFILSQSLPENSVLQYGAQQMQKWVCNPGHFIFQKKTFDSSVAVDTTLAMNKSQSHYLRK